MIAARSVVTTGGKAVAVWPSRVLYHFLLNAYWVLLRILSRRKRPAHPQSNTVLLTGTFYSENWILNHLNPLAASAPCDRIWLVTTFAIPAIEKVEAIYPPSWLIRAVGEVPARLIVFIVIAVRRRPDFVGGFHLLPNGLIALLVARLMGSSSVYFCGGGPREVEGGGYYSGARSFQFLQAPDTALERKLLRAVDEIDLVVTMGGGAKDFFQRHGVRSRDRSGTRGHRFRTFSVRRTTKEIRSHSDRTTSSGKADRSVSSDHE